MYETKFEIMQGVEDGIEMFKKLIKPIMVLALISFLISISQLLVDPSYLEVLNGQIGEIDRNSRLMNQLITFALLPIMGAVAVMLLYYYKEEFTGKIPLGDKITSSIKCSVKLLLATIALFIPLLLLMMIGLFISIATRMVLFPIITGLVLLVVLLIAIPLFMFAYEGMVFDDMGTFQAIKHSFKLVKHNYFRLLLLTILLGGASMIVTRALRFHIVGTILSMMISAITSKLFLCINCSIYLQARPKEDKIYEKTELPEIK